MRPWWLWTAWWSALQRITSTAGHWLKVQWHSVDQLWIRHLLFAGILPKCGNLLEIDLEGLHTNLLMINTIHPSLNAQQLCDRLAMVRLKSPLILDYF
jgi:hypothetical protein